MPRGERGAGQRMNGSECSGKREQFTERSAGNCEQRQYLNGVFSEWVRVTTEPSEEKTK